MAVGGTVTTGIRTSDDDDVDVAALEEVVEPELDVVVSDVVVKTNVAGLEVVVGSDVVVSEVVGSAVVESAIVLVAGGGSVDWAGSVVVVAGSGVGAGLVVGLSVVTASVGVASVVGAGLFVTSGSVWVAATWSELAVLELAADTTAANASRRTRSSRWGRGAMALWEYCLARPCSAFCSQ